jgi:peptidyl-prolyl cis-trans isomerase C
MDGGAGQSQPRAGLDQFTMKARLSSLIREPLAQFLLAGLAIFVVSSFFGGFQDDGERTIVVDAAQTENLAAGFFQTWRRPPNQQELDALISDYVRGEVYYREAKRIGLDVDDPVIRNRLRAKMEYITVAQAEAVQPSDTELKAWFEGRKAIYASEVEYSFDQVFIDPSKPGNPQQRASQGLLQLRGGADWEKVSDPIPLPASLTSAKRGEIARDFGKPFTTELDTISSGQWSGPIRSGLGLHLVRLRDRQTFDPPEFADVRDKVEIDWRFDSKAKRERAVFEALLKDYQVKIERK